MAERYKYEQYCPIAIAAEVMGERWTPLVLRGLYCGATRFNDIQACVPRMSPSLLSRRLKELEAANVIVRQPVHAGRGHIYALTQAGQELFPTLQAMGEWAQKWLRREIVSDHNLDPDVFMWELRHGVEKARLPDARRRVIEFRLSGVPSPKRHFWLLLEPGHADICVSDPGFDIDLWVSASLRTMVELWLGHRSIDGAIKSGDLQLDGTRGEQKLFRQWFVRSVFAPSGQMPAADIGKATRQARL